MSKATKPRETYITLGYAADILGRRRQEIDILVRREKVVDAVGKRGKGGQLRVDLGELPDLEAAAELFDLKIPPKAIREVFSRRSKDALRITVVYRKGDMQVLEDPSSSAKLRTPERRSRPSISLRSAGSSPKDLISQNALHHAVARSSISSRCART